jgi:hypothetical protein
MVLEEEMCRLAFAMDFIALFMFAAWPGGMFPGNISLHLTALITANDRYERRNEEADIEMVFMEPTCSTDSGRELESSTAGTVERAPLAATDVQLDLAALFVHGHMLNAPLRRKSQNGRIE